jgi:hypothetical protein
MDDKEIWCKGCGKLLGFESAAVACDCSECGEAIERDDGWYCPQCANWDAWKTWREATLDAVAEIASEFGWEFRRLPDSGPNVAAGRRTQYHDLSRGDETFCLRISDHGTAHCNERISLAMQPDLLDHTLEQLRARMMQPPESL